MTLAPTSSRPYMPDYGTLPADQGTGLLPWSWAVERLTTSHDYWVATVGADGTPAVSPVWGQWMGDAFWFSCGPNSRKSRNLQVNAGCTVATDNAFEPVVLEGTAALDSSGSEAFTARGNEKYEQTYAVEFFLANHLYRVVPSRAFGLTEGDFNGSPTRWRF